MKTYVLGDIHNRYQALLEVLKASDFQHAKDKLIILGDVIDGGLYAKECVEELLKIENKVYILGNHCDWFIKHMENGWAEEIWLQQGGSNTLRSYGAKVVEAQKVTDESLLDTTDLNIPVTHQEFFNNHKLYHIEKIKGMKMCFVHGGFNPYKHPRYEKRFNLLWDRELIRFARDGHTIPYFDKIFVGHTTTQTYGMDQPIRFNNVYMMDCGAGWNGRLAMMNVVTEETFLSQIQKPIRTPILTDESYKQIVT